MRSVQPEKEVTAGNEWIRYQEFEVIGDDVKPRIDKFWHRIFSRTDASGDHFVILPKMVKCALALCNSNADVERLLRTNVRISEKQNISLSEDTIIGLRAIKADVDECGSMNKVPITLDLLKVVNNSHRIYMEHLRQQN